MSSAVLPQHEPEISDGACKLPQPSVPDTDLQRLMVAYTLLLLNLTLSSLMAKSKWKPYRESVNHSSN